MQAAAVIVNFFLPGVGSIMLGKVAEGVIQLIFGLVLPLLLMIIPIIGWLIAFLLGITVRIWAMISAATARVDKY